MNGFSFVNVVERRQNEQNESLGEGFDVSVASSNFLSISVTTLLCPLKKQV